MFEIWKYFLTKCVCVRAQYLQQNMDYMLIRRLYVLLKIFPQPPMCNRRAFHFPIKCQIPISECSDDYSIGDKIADHHPWLRAAMISLVAWVVDLYLPSFAHSLTSRWKKKRKNLCVLCSAVIVEFNSSPLSYCSGWICGVKWVDEEKKYGLISKEHV